jgi:hypothetical protein
MRGHLIGWAIAATMLVASPAFAAPAKVADPTAAIRQVYQMLEKDNGYSVELPLSPRLKALMELDLKEAGPDEIGRLDFDYFVNGQDSQITHSTVTARSVDKAADRQLVVVTFHNFDAAMENHFFWEKINGEWMLDDVRSVDPKDGGWTLSLVLKYGWDGPESAEAASRSAAAAAEAAIDAANDAADARYKW